MNDIEPVFEHRSDEIQLQQTPNSEVDHSVIAQPLGSNIF